MVEQAKENPKPFGLGFSLIMKQDPYKSPPGYASDERSSLGERADCRRWREEGGKRVAGVGEGRRLFKAEGIRRAPQQGRYAELLFVYVRHKDNTIASCRPNQQYKSI